MRIRVLRELGVSESDANGSFNRGRRWLEIECYSGAYIIHVYPHIYIIEIIFKQFT